MGTIADAKFTHNYNCYNGHFIGCLRRKHQKEFLKDLKLVYQAVSKEAAETELLNLDSKWREQYPIVIKSWQDNWEKLTEYFLFTVGIRKLIYTTNTVEGYHRQIRKVTKKQGRIPFGYRP